ncbi:glycine receptor subunit alpha-4-like isoform X3 [Lineus longissimus]
MMLITAILLLLQLHYGSPSLRRANATNYRIGLKNETHEEFIHRLLKTGYNPHLRPGLEIEQVDRILVGVYINSFSAVDEIHMDYSVNVYLRRVWNDSRLAYFPDYNESMTLSYMHKNIWSPDLYFINEKKGYVHTITHENRLLSVSPYGKITLSEKMSITLTCHMNLEFYPHDVQVCGMYMESYGYTTQEVMFDWLPGDNAIHKNDDLELPEFTIGEIKWGNCTKNYLLGSFTCLYAKFYFKRESGYYIIQTYVPSILYVFLSWVSFWIDYRAAPARISLGLLTVVAITTQSAGARSQLPRVSYIKAIDVWMATCLTFVFGALIEFAIANFFARRAEAIKNRLEEEAKQRLFMSENANSTMEMVETPIDGSGDNNDRNTNHKAYYEEDEVRVRLRHSSTGTSLQSHFSHHAAANRKNDACAAFYDGADATDFYSRFMFPLAFIVFNITYWIYYTQSTQNTK